MVHVRKQMANDAARVLCVERVVGRLIRSGCSLSLCKVVAFHLLLVSLQSADI